MKKDGNQNNPIIPNMLMGNFNDETIEESNVSATENIIQPELVGADIFKECNIDDFECFPDLAIVDDEGILSEKLVDYDEDCYCVIPTPTCDDMEYVMDEYVMDEYVGPASTLDEMESIIVSDFDGVNEIEGIIASD